MATVSINKLLKTTDNDGDTKAFFYLETKWMDNQVFMKLQDSQSGKCYQGTLTTQNFKDSASELEEPFNDYYEECRTALTTYIANPGYTYKLDEEERIFKVWKGTEDSIPMLYLEISLNLIRNHYDIFDSAIEQLQCKSKALTERVAKAHKFDENSRELLEDYRICVEEKNQLEKKLLRKVSILLNSKKQKICELEDQLRKYDRDAVNSGDDTSMESADEEKPQSSRKQRPLVVESDSEEDEDFIANTEILTLPDESR